MVCSRSIKRMKIRRGFILVSDSNTTTVYVIYYLQVSFAENEKLVNIVEFDDDLDSKKTRECYWEIFARDRARFKDRVEQAAAVLNPILESEHRDRVYNGRQTEARSELSMDSPAE